MFRVDEDNTIHLTRGDILFFSVTAKEEDGTSHMFSTGDEVTMRIFEKKKCEKVYLQKGFPVLEDTQQVSIYLGKEDTTFGDPINKPKEYWYEVEVNSATAPQTIIGYGEAGPAVIWLYPEGKESNT